MWKLTSYYDGVYMLSTSGHAGKESELGLALSIHKIHKFLGLG